MIKIQRICYKCKTEKIFEFTAKDYKKYLQWVYKDLLIQEALPNINAADRELIKGGMCGECWNKIFGSPEDDYEDEDYQDMHADLDETGDCSKDENIS